MKLPPDVRFEPEVDLLVWKPRGVLSEKVVNKIIAFIREQETLSESSELRFIDTTALTGLNLTSDTFFTWLFTGDFLALGDQRSNRRFGSKTRHSATISNCTPS